MVDINFLSENKDASPKSKEIKRKEEQELKWSEPGAGGKVEIQKSNAEKEDIGLFSFFKKGQRRSDSPAYAKKPEILTSVEKADKERKEILKPIKKVSADSNGHGLPWWSRLFDNSKKKEKKFGDIPSASKNEKAEKKTIVSAPKTMESETKESPDILETNLIKDEIVSFFEWKKNLFTLIIFVVLSCFAVGIAYAGIMLWGSEKSKSTEITGIDLDKLNEQIKILEGEIKSVPELQNRLSLVSELIRQHIYWTNFFKFLEDNTHKNVYFMSFSGDIKGNYELSGKAPDFKTILDQVAALRKNEYVEEVKVSGGTVGFMEKEETESEAIAEKVIDFKLSLKIKPAIFIK